jgi:DNA polymerase-1
MQKLLSTYIDVMPEQADAEGRLHAHFSQTGAATGRMSSSNPNLQNIPVKDSIGREIRKGIVATPGFSLVALDYSQIELRVLALLSKDPKLTAVFASGGDIHRATAAEIFGVDPAAVDSEMRRVAKVVNFGILYGMGITALDKLIGRGRQEATRFYSRYFEQFPTIAAYLEKTKRFAEVHGYTETYFGRRRHFADIRSKIPYIKAAAERMAVNAPIQGTSADIIKMAMGRMHNIILEKKWEKDVFLLMQVHDELVYEIKKEKIAEAVPVIKEVMEGIILPEEANGIPFIVEPKIGQNWGEMKKYEAD